MNKLIVWFDGSCPLCRREIALMQRLDRRGRIDFIDLGGGEATTCPIDRAELLRRFHAEEDGRLVSGAEAFAAMWRAIPLLRPFGLIARNRILLRMLEALYLRFLRVRPRLQRLVGRWEGSNGQVPEIIRPGPGQESVWDYPRPPSLEAVAAEIIVIFAGETIAKTSAAFRVLETSHPPVYYIPPRDVRLEFIVPASGQSYCEYKGVASYVSIVANSRRSEQAGWRYVEPTKSYHAITGYLAFYASRVDEARVGSEIVKPQPGDFYGGWVTSNIVGPFKGAVGTKHW